MFSSLWCVKFGIPTWIVRLRHDATHGSLPSLDLLVAGCRWALTYLQVVLAFDYLVKIL